MSSGEVFLPRKDGLRGGGWWGYLVGVNEFTLLAGGARGLLVEALHVAEEDDEIGVRLSGHERRQAVVVLHLGGEE